MKLSTSTEWLYFHLWKKNSQTGASCPGVFLVDTIIYRWAQPYFWYFTNREGQIIRKTKERIDIQKAQDIFIYNVPQSGIVAQYLVSQNHNQQQQEVIQFEYFNEDQFNIFIHQREKNLNAILQKFIQPKGGVNSLIKISWSPQFCLLYRKTNINKLDNTKVPMNERLCTFEGPEYLAIQDSITSPILSADLEQICVNIVKHIQDISGGNIQISRMVLYFKLDDKNRLWLLFCTGLKVRERFQEYKELNTNTQQIPRMLSPIFKLQKTITKHIIQWEPQ
ncbi:hypothetical protein IMG5_137950 [Ichthyophthirius multifiliis]|uniref:Uncharacterized protein n=1 Tax=Ichthyophthirius multifiliis TaxID=5932 RepID=G0QX49_ICHMU|nr:hypothetical protein IMG5_137950 [Ichthyophthirius multifiliis]EGR30206.1 hypothetical protein IMG5_137950 [Ichthyophthirius multifiliis]|eukprot:XP_004031802.1 hypothetical protein IMG5_137950 [Ichthyophthirius multifiliis]